MFEPRPWIKRRACSRSRTVAPVLHYLRVLRGVLRQQFQKKNKCQFFFSSLDFFFSASNVIFFFRLERIFFFRLERPSPGTTTVQWSHHSIIPLWIYRIPSELRSQARLGPISTAVGDHAGILGVECFFF